MNARFKEHIEALEPKFRELLSMQPTKLDSLPRKMPKSGIYLFSEGSDHLYVGRSKRLPHRLRYHASGQYSIASFAFLLAREATGQLKATYTKRGSRVELQQQPAFQQTFTRSSARIRAMDIRFVEEADSVRQALLEIYAAISLNTRYNKFETT